MAMFTRSKPFWCTSREMMPMSGHVRLGGEAELLEQGPLARRLPRLLGLVEGGGDVGIVPRVPLLVVDAVQDAHEIVGAGPHHAFEPLAELRGLDLAGVGGRHRGHDLGEEQAALHVRDVAVPIEGVLGVERLGEARAGPRVAGEKCP